MRFVISSYKRNGDSIGLFEVHNNEYKKLSNSGILAPSFIISCKDYVYTFEKNDELRFFSYKVENNELILSDTFLMPGTSITHLTYSKVNKIIIGCSYNDGSYFSLGVKNGVFLKPYTYSKIPVDKLSRCHCVLLNKQETDLAVVNISLDAVYLYDIIEKNLVFKDIIKLPEGIGPRHAIYNADDTLMYLISEYSNEVFIIDMASKQIIQRISTVYNFTDKTFGATLLFSKNQEFLYASNRGEDSIAKFKVLDNGMLEYLNSFSSGGAHPRHMQLSNDGKFLISCNMHGNNVAIIDLQTEKVSLKIPFEQASGITILND